MRDNPEGDEWVMSRLHM